MPDEIETLPHASARAKMTMTVVTSTGTRTLAVAPGASLTVGRSETADVTVDDASLSRVHARLELGPPLRLTDLGSSNGSWVAGEALVAQQPVTVARGQVIELGAVVLLVQGGAVPTRTETDSPGLGPAMAAVVRAAQNAAAHDLNVLILGDTGVGKNVVARSIHEQSARATHPFVVIDCAALAHDVADSELFGHEQGAFTGARSAKPGLLEVAQHGTAFIDEVGELPTALQAKLLRAIEDRKVRRVGGVVDRELDVRFIAATNRDLQAEIEAGSFRRDLFYRLNAVTLTIPPLCERVGEIAPLAAGFLRDLAAPAAPPTLEAEAMLWMRSHPWPGNIRELRNAMERGFAAAGPGGRIAVADVRSAASTSPGSAASADSASTERDRIAAALLQCAGNQTKAAALLGISRRTLVHRLDLYGLPRPRKR